MVNKRETERNKRALSREKAMRARERKRACRYRRWGSWKRASERAGAETKSCLILQNFDVIWQTNGADRWFLKRAHFPNDAYHYAMGKRGGGGKEGRWQKRRQLAHLGRFPN